ncbi:MAG TPA: phage major capsid protein [Ktedonobacteraceae bacterium]
MSPMSTAERVRNFRDRKRREQELRDDADAYREAQVTCLTRAVLATSLAKLDASIKPVDFAKQWNDSKVELILRAAVSPTSLSSAPALAQVTTAFLETLVPMSAGADLLARGINLNFSGAASITMPGIATPTVDFVGEGQPIPVVSAPTSAGPTLVPHKIAAIAALTSEIMQSSNAETLVRQALIDATGPALDKAMFSTTAAGTDRPAGLLNGIAALTPAAAGQAKGEILVDDVQKLASAVAPVAGNGEIVLVASPDAAVALVLRMPQHVDWPVLTSASLAARTVIAIAANAVVSAVEGAPQIDARRDPSVTWDTSSGNPIGSMFQTDTVALRLRWPISWTLRTSNGIAWMQNVNW